MGRMSSEVLLFASEVAVQLKTYVYRLIDPRNGETFYVGKGTGNRCALVQISGRYARHGR